VILTDGEQEKEGFIEASRSDTLDGKSEILTGSQAALGTV
jgi:hypothetical protein